VALAATFNPASARHNIFSFDAHTIRSVMPDARDLLALRLPPMS
jgi:hypothetical protein